MWDVLSFADSMPGDTSIDPGSYGFGVWVK